MNSPSDEAREPRFLTVVEVLALHEHSVRRYGGAPGVRDASLLESAVAMPEQSAFGELAHPNLHDQAGAYLYHLCKNHPFFDGNKRVALLACEAFLNRNEKELTLTNEEAVKVVVGVASGTMTKDELLRTLETKIQDLRHTQEVLQQQATPERSPKTLTKKQVRGFGQEL